MSEHPNLNFRRQGMRPTKRIWLKHSIFLLLTLFTATIAGVLQPFGKIQIFPDADPQTWNEIFQFFSSLPSHYYHLIVGTIHLLFTDPTVLTHGLSFSLSLLFILICHEGGHYIACRLYGVDATLPYFIPTPPLFGPAGTLGAFIKIVSPMPSRRAVFDIGVAGPIAGFLALIPIAFLGVWTMGQVPIDNAAGGEIGLYFSDPLLIRGVAFLLGKDLTIGFANSPFYAAAWLGLLVTALNLFPSGQLDGGHALYSIFGSTVHKWSGRIVFVIAFIFAVSGWFLYSSPSNFLFAILLGVMMRVGHPEPYDETPLDFKRKVIAVLTVLIFIVSFVPFPVQVR